MGVPLPFNTILLNLTFNTSDPRFDTIFNNSGAPSALLHPNAHLHDFEIYCTFATPFGKCPYGSFILLITYTFFTYET